MRIVLDLQSCQSPESRRRGIGRYSLALAKAMAESPRGHHVTVLLNAAMDGSIEFLRGQFDGLLPQTRLVTWEALAPSAFIEPDNRFRRRASEILRMQAVQRLNPDIVHISSLFEGLADDVIATVPAERIHLGGVTLYDLIPLAHQQTYLGDPRIRRWYMEKIEDLRRADVLLGISQYSCDEAVDLLNIPRERLADISGAVDDNFRRLDDAEGFRDELMHRYGLRRPFVMYAGGFDARKNIGALIRGFALLPAALRRAHQLAIVGGAPEPERVALTNLAIELGLGDGEVVFTGYVSDDDLVKLYNLCALYVFPSLQEGFGLPALEAMSSGAVVIGSNTSSLPEVIGHADALFDPLSDDAIAAKMILALTDRNFRFSLREHAERQCLKFSWKESARRAIDAFEAAFDRRQPVSSVVVPERFAAAAGSTAFLPAPRSSAPLMQSGRDSVVIYADSDCVEVSTQHSLGDFVRDRGSNAFDRIVIELADEAYCAKTLALACSGNVDIMLRDGNFGKPLQAMAQNREARELVLALLYRSGGYAAVRTAMDGGFDVHILGTLVKPLSLATLGRSQVLPDTRRVDKAAPDGSAWRDDMRGPIAELMAVESINDATTYEWARLAAALSSNNSVASDTAQWLVDISNLVHNDAGTGIQRVVRHVLDELIKTPMPGYRVEPVYLDDDGAFRYARNYCARRYFRDEKLPIEEPVEFIQGDVYVGLDLAAHLITAHIQLFRHMRNRGVRQYYVLYDLLPVLRPDCFLPHLLPLFRGWYEAIAEVADGILCISRAVADEFESWLHQARPARQRSLGIGWFHLGADLTPTDVKPVKQMSSAPLAVLKDRPTFLMVGTIEPRKGHAQALDAFEQLWQHGVQANLLIIGQRGWLVEDLLRRIEDHPQQRKRLFWFDKAADDLLVAAYHRASALIMASEGEGFGLPLIEAARHGLPLIVRDLPVFREVAAQHAYYFSGYDGRHLNNALLAWLELDAQGGVPQPTGVGWNTWKEAAEQMVDLIRNERWVHRWMPAPVRRFGAFDHRFHTQVGRLERGRMKGTGEAGLLIYGPYVSLAAGRYVVRIHGGGTGIASMDACSACGETIHLYKKFAAPDIEGSTLLTEVELVLKMDVTDLEIRVRVEHGSDLWVGEIEIHPLSMKVVEPPQVSIVP